MPLIDLFHPPISTNWDWSSFHTMWCSEIAADLNAKLPSRFLAQATTHLGSSVEMDVGEFELLSGYDPLTGKNGAIAVQTWTAPKAAASIDFRIPDDFEVKIVDTEETRKLLAVIEIISPSNKDRPESRSSFAGKCASYLQTGVGLIIVDTVTKHHFNLHNELMEIVGGGKQILPKETHLYAVGYQPVIREGNVQLDIWPESLKLGTNLPTLPLALKRWFHVPVDLELTYMESRRRNRL